MDWYKKKGSKRNLEWTEVCYLMQENNAKTISVTHLNIRQGISFMIVRFFVIEVIFDSLILFLYLPLSYIELPFGATEEYGKDIFY